MRDVLERLAAGELSVAAAEAELAGYATTDAGRFDAARETRRGVPEAVLAEGKTPAEVGALAATAVETAGRALVTRADGERRAAVRAAMAEEHPDADVRVDERARVVVAHAPAFEPPALDATVGLVSGGTSDAAALGEADAVATEMGARTERVEDVGVASIARLLDRVDGLRACDVVVVAAGREGALPTVVAGLLDAPVIGLPVSTGYGHGGRGEAAMLGMLQSCTVLSAVNVDAGFVAGAQAGLIARRIAAAREG
ncbi:NCAIR mutase (PurE)-related protein [Halarchaeum rubridurum]|uniref:NCAIR mutase (PurE)-related protein n=1 Tax=Halarchaeum rubridurum TaxID=489911 RepID=A0A830FXD6_9EURY|nr:nickel pincer cofactor biosynthesis protein LarB [Halarchaeum rubridurum]MBP1954317.1 NCAIR mutase (PurE)-related protein [Halarchaeum rubridurum]GGM59042.1 phosphoribosylaminoimidazole carboxylase [Halarchaeum rubridurum]